MRLGLRNQWLLALAHPAGPRASLPAKALKPSAWRTLLEQADRHGVLPAVMANARTLGATDGGPVVPDAVAKAGESQLILRSAQALQLRRQTEELCNAFSAAKVPCIVLKGCEFADRLYRSPSLRTFTDVDLLVPRLRQAAAMEVLRAQGYGPKATGIRHAATYGETAWRHTRRRCGTVELHWNLVNSPALQKSLGFTYEDLPKQADGRATATCLLLIAVVHAASSHAFDRLGPLCDIALSVVGAAGPIDIAWLRGAAARPSVALALTAGLGLSGELLGDEACTRLRKALQLPNRWLWRTCLSAGMVLRLHARRDSFRRQAFRQMLKGT